VSVCFPPAGQGAYNLNDRVVDARLTLDCRS
jgi:hypothetical protein